MIPNRKDREVESSGVTESAEFGISLADSAHIMTILRDTLYSDKVLAVLREYGANAWDAHREAGKHDVPIKIKLPTKHDQTLTIRDYGPGLSPERVLNVFTKYGASTKRESDDMVGALGIGCKSGFAYSDSFTVTSWYGGRRRVYIAVLDDSNKGMMNLLDEGPAKETGVEIQIAVRPEDIFEFHDKAAKLFQYFTPHPVINIDLPEAQQPEAVLKNGHILGSHRHSSASWVAVMGCVPYKVVLEQLKKPDGKSMIIDSLHRMSGCLYFGIGDVQISASREELKYTAKTKQALAQKFEALVDEYVEQAFRTIDSDKTTNWEKKVHARVFNELGLPVPKQWKHFVEEFFVIDTAKTFTIQQNKNAVSRINVQERSRLIVQDENRDLTGYRLDYGDYLIKPEEGATLDKVLEELDKIIVAKKMEGIPIVKLSSITWVQPYKPQRRAKPHSRKYQVSTFRFVPDARRSPKSAAWEIEEREPLPEDVFVILQNFNSVGHQFYPEYSSDAELARPFNGKMPTVYGYKTTDKKPVVVSSCLGTHYPLWRPNLVRSLLTPRVEKFLNHWIWAQALTDEYNHKRQQGVAEKALRILTENLGEFHPITQLVAKKRNGIRALARLKDTTKRSIMTLADRIEKDKEETEPKLVLATLYETYPLLEIANYRIHALWKDEHEKWIEYVKLVDRALATNAE